MIPAQTGFVSGIGTSVNLVRAIQRIKIRTSKKRSVTVSLSTLNPHIIRFIMTACCNYSKECWIKMKFYF